MKGIGGALVTFGFYSVTIGGGIENMNNKTEIAFGKHIKRLEKDVAEAQTRIDERGLSIRGMDAVGQRDDLKKIALLREGVVPKYSDLPVASIGGENNLPAIEMFEFSDIDQGK